MSDEMERKTDDGGCSAAAIKQGTFGVDSSGQATYRVPIVVPPGINGQSPRLGLCYNHRSGNGPLGVGWSIEGMSALTRVGANYATDGYRSAINFDASDRLSLDGQRLVNVSGDYWGSEAGYATEVQHWLKVSAGASDSEGFVVVAKNGEVHEYGKTVDSRILSGASGSPVRVWALNAIQDLDGNRIEYSYTQPVLASGGASGAFYLQTIRYTTRQDGAATANRFVALSYSGRTDPIVSYLGGGQVVVDRLLDTITSYIGELGQPDSVVTSYRLHYATSVATRRSRLARLSVTGAAADGSPALPDIQFTWQDVITPAIGSDQLNTALGQGKILALDVNGDGLTDVVQFYNDADSGSLCIDSYLASYCDGRVVFNAQATSHIQTTYPDSKKLFATDVDGDGRGDLVVVYPDASNGNTVSIDIILSNGQGFSAPQTVHTGNAFVDSDLFFVVDLNGDGRSDLVQATLDAQSQTLVLNCYVTSIESGATYFGDSTSIATGLPFPSNGNCLLAADINGDGLTDLVLLTEDAGTQQTRVNCLITTQAQRQSFAPFNVITGGVLLDVPFAQRGTLLPADPNGDGLTDMVRVFQDGDGSMRFQSYLSDGVGHFSAGAVSAGFSPCPNLFPMGFFGGNATDILGCWTDPTSGKWTFEIYSASPAGDFSHTATVNTEQTLSQLSLLIGDVTGNGKADFLFAYLDANACVNIQPYLSVGPYPDLLSSIEDQLGGLTRIDYQPLTNASVYSSGAVASFPKSSARRYCNHLSPAQFPIQSVVGQSVYVVSNYTLSNAPERNRYPYSYAYSLSYADAQIDLLGRGWQGFRQVSTLNQCTQLLTRQVYNLDFPFTGQVAAVSTETGGAPLTLALTTYLSRPSSIYARQNSVEVLATGILNYIYTNGAFDFVTAKVFADVHNGTILNYDAYGGNLRETWYGYVEYIDPAIVMSPSPSRPAGNPILPGLLKPLQSGEMVYRHRDFLNDQSAWVLGLPAHQKASRNPVDHQIATFNPGDLTLTATTYYPGSYNRQSVANWDNSNQCFLSHNYQYDGFGNCVAETLPGDRTTQYVFEATYHTYVDQVISPKNEQGLALVSYAAYDPRFGIRIAEQSVNGFIAVSALDGFGRLLAKQGPVPAQTQSDTNRLSRLATGSRRDLFLAANVVSLETLVYRDDAQQGIYALRQVLQHFPQDAARSWVSTLQFADGLSRERLSAVSTGNGGGTAYSVVTSDYATDAKLTRKALPFFCANLATASATLYTTYRYDALGRPLQAVQPSGANGEQSVTTLWHYDRSGVVTQIQAANTAAPFVQCFTHHGFDGKDCIVQTAVASYDGAITGFQFDPLARNLQSIDPNGICNTLSYDSLSRKTTQDNPDQNPGGTVPALRYRYDAASGLLASQTDAAEASIEYRYDQLCRVLSTTFQDGRKFSYQYDTALNGLGCLATITITQGDTVESTRGFAYDEYGNVVEETLSILGEAQAFTTRSRYDAAKRLVAQTLPDQTELQRGYTDGLLSMQSLDGVQVSYSAFTPAGNYTALNYNNGAAFTYRRNPLDQLYAESLTSGGRALLTANYLYDPLNQVLQIQEQQSAETATQQYAYQGERLVSARIPGFETTRYQYDGGGNLHTKNTDLYRYDAHFPTQVESAGAVTYSATRDACGRTQSRTVGGQTLGFQYDGLGCLRAVKDGGGKPLLHVVSDDSGQRLRQEQADGTIILTISAHYQVVKTAAASLVRKNLFDGAGALASITTRAGTTQQVYFRRDHKGSITHCLDARGALQNQLRYDAFGQAQAVIGTVPELPLYESRSWDRTTELYYFGARYYDPVRASFLTPDTRLGGSSALQCNVWNRFAFELNNPLNHIDPSGHDARWVAGLAVGIVLIVAGAALTPAAGSGSIMVGVGVGALIGGGVAAVVYSVQHSADFDWKDFGIQVGVNVGIGALAGGLMAGVSGPIASSSSKALYGAIAGAMVGAAAGASASALTSLAEGESVNGSAIGIAAGFGFLFGAIGGAVSGKIGNRYEAEIVQFNDANALARTRGARYTAGTGRFTPAPGANGDNPVLHGFQVHSPADVVRALRIVKATMVFADVVLPIAQAQVGNPF